MSQYYYPSLRNTYELESQPNYQKYMDFNMESNLYPKINTERLSTSPPIILCETGNTRNKNNHSHKYLFYPSTSRLSPFSDNMNNTNNDYNIIKKPYLNFNNYNSKNDNNYNFKNDIRNKLRDNKLLINDDKNENSKNDNNLEGRMIYKNNLEKKRINTPQNINKYQTMFDKSLELMKTISTFIPEEDGKIKGNSSYYYNRDRDYDTIIEKQKNFLQKYFLNKSGSQNQIETDIYSNNNNNLKNKSDDQFKNNFTNVNDNIEINSNNNFVNRKNNENNNLGSFSSNNNIKNNKDFINNDNNIRVNARNAFDNNSNENNNFNYDKNIPNNNFNNKTTNQPNLDTGLVTMDNFIGNRGTSINPYNFRNNSYDNSKGNDNYNDNKYNRNYINDYNNMNLENNMKNEIIKPKTLLKMKEDNNKYDINGFQSNNFDNHNNISSNKDNLNINNLDDKQNLKNNLNLINLENNDKDFKNISYNENSYFNSGMSNLPTKDFFNTNNMQKRNQNQTTNYNQPLSQTDNNLDQNFREQNSSPNFNFQSNPINYYENNKDNNNNVAYKNNIINDNLLPSVNNKDTNNIINNSNIDIDNNNQNNRLKEENIEEKKESESFGELLDKNNEKILSEEGKPFQREIVNEKYGKDNKAFVITKSGENLKLSILHNREGMPLTYNGYPLLGKGEKYFIDRSGKPIVYLDDNYMEGEEKIPVKIKELSKKELDDLNNRINNINLNPENDNFQFINTLASKYSFNDNNPNNYYNLGYGGGLSTTQLKKSRIFKGKNRHFPKGDGDAKPPILKKKRKRRLLKK